MTASIRADPDNAAARQRFRRLQPEAVQHVVALGIDGLASVDQHGLTDQAFGAARHGLGSVATGSREKIGFAWVEGSKESAIFIQGGSAARGRW